MTNLNPTLVLAVSIVGLCALLGCSTQHAGASHSGSGADSAQAGHSGASVSGSSGRATAGAPSAGIAAVVGGHSGHAGDGGKSGAASAGHGAAGATSAGAAAAGSGAAGSGSDTICDQASDCTVGEINHEILSKTDCLCLYGCPYLPLNKTTAARRQSQYAALCDPQRNGQGQPCPIDDCVALPAPMCVDHLCILPKAQTQ